MKALASGSLESMQRVTSKKFIRSSNERDESVVPIFDMDHIGKMWVAYFGWTDSAVRSEKLKLDILDLHLYLEIRTVWFNIF